jgi:predicted lipoprotein with Yx(FWY)xxD motif
MRTFIVVASLLTLGAIAVPAAAPASGGAVTSHASRYGAILFDGRGFVLYAFTHDSRGKSTCSGACAKAWPPFLVKGAAPKGRLLGTTRRADGSRQVTYAGRPLYYYVGDRQPGQILCQNVSEFGGLWLVVRPDGSVVR